jgi:single-strand DNA-binding protein
MDTLILGDALIATTPRFVITSDGTKIMSCRVATKRGDKNENTNWWTLTAFGDLADKMFAELHKGDRLTVVGKPEVRDWENDERTGTTIEVIAESFYPIRVSATV